jgi:hypothetical protein
MSLVDNLKNAVENNDWSLVLKALYELTGDNSYLDSNKKKSEKKQKTISDDKKEKMENKFVDDISLESHLIQKNPRRTEKTYRKPFSEKDFYTNAKCSSCGTEVKVPVEEQRFRKMDSESSDFTCIKCIRKIR